MGLVLRCAGCGDALLRYAETPNARTLDMRGVAALRMTTAEPRATMGGVNLVIGFRPSLWATIAGSNAPRHAPDFIGPVTGRDGYTMCESACHYRPGLTSGYQEAAVWCRRAG